MMRSCKIGFCVNDLFLIISKQNEKDHTVHHTRFQRRSLKNVAQFLSRTSDSIKDFVGPPIF